MEYLQGISISDEELRVLLTLHMVSDPTPLDPPDDKTFTDLVDRLARARGYDGWVDAYHQFKPGS